MKITEAQLRRLIREQVDRGRGPTQLTNRQMRYISNNGLGGDHGYGYGDEDSNPDYIGIIPDEVDSDDWRTPFDDTYWTIQVTPEIADKVYQESSVYKKGPVTIPSGWFWEHMSDYGGMIDVKGPFSSREEAKQDCLDSHHEIITPERVQTAPSTGSDVEIGF